MLTSLHRLLPAVAALILLAVAPSSGHDTPFSYLDLHLRGGAIQGSLVVHAIDVAHDLGLESPQPLAQEAVVDDHRDRLVALLSERLTLIADDTPLELTWGDAEAVPERQSLRVRFRGLLVSGPGVIRIQAQLFPYDPKHQTFLNVYEDEALVQQAIFDGSHASVEYFPGTLQGTRAVVRRFVGAGIHHIMIGPDHVLFLIGLLLLGGSLWRLLAIVTAFTLAHSITLSLATLDVLNPSGRLIEPAIALSIVYVGADNLLVAREGRDVRAWIAFSFGLIHGFGFASVLKELDLPRRALGWSLASFNVGVELGQVAIVIVVASIVTAIWRRDARLARRLTVGGSVLVMAAGTYWFIERVFFPGGA